MRKFWSEGILVIALAASAGGSGVRAAEGGGVYIGPSLQNLHATPDSGFYADNLEDLAGASEIIVRGRYGELLRHFDFYGYDATGQDKPPPDAASGRSGNPGVPISEYEILPAEILKGGHLVSTPLVLRIVEQPAPPRSAALLARRQGEHLYFFALNPDRRTVGLHGSMFDMKETPEAYTYLLRGVETAAFGFADKTAFMQRLDQILKSSAQP